MFVEELTRFAAAAADPRCAAIAERLGVPVRVSVTGCPAVGRRTVSRALARAGLSVTDLADADLVVRVIADAVKPEDRAAVDAERRPVIVLLNKADLVATTASARYPGGPTAAARARCDRLTARTGLAVEPVIGLLAAAELDDARWAALQASAGGAAGRSVEGFGAFGTRQAVAAIGRGASRADVGALMRTLSNLDAVLEKVTLLTAPQRYQRVLTAVAELETLAVTDARVAGFLTRDDTVVARMNDAMDAAEAAGTDVDRADTAAAHLRRARRWQSHRRGPAGPLQVCGDDIVRGSLRRWATLGGAA